MSAPSGSLLLEADFFGGNVRAFRATSTSPFWAVLKIRDDTGAVRRREEFAPNATRSVNIPTALRTLLLEKSVTEDGVTRLEVSPPVGWRLSLAFLEDGRLPGALA